MPEMGKKIKSAFIRSMEAISNTAGNVASNTRYKVSEMNLLNRREEILNTFGNKAYELYQQGEVFPAVLMAELKELSEVDDRLAQLRAEHQTKPAEAPEAEEISAEPEGSVLPDETDAVDAVLAPEAPVPELPEVPLAEEKPAEPMPVLQVEPAADPTEEENA